MAIHLDRRAPERALAWIYTGPLGHFYGAAADIAVLWARWGVNRLRARAGARPAR